MLALMAWLLRTDGRRYRAHADARVFRILYQPREGALWSTVAANNGTPVSIAVGASAATFLAAVGGIPGSYQLVPCDHAGRPRGTSPQRVDLDAVTAVSLVRFRAPPASPVRRRQHQGQPRPVEPSPGIERLRRRHQGGDG